MEGIQKDVLGWRGARKSFGKGEAEGARTLAFFTQKSNKGIDHRIVEQVRRQGVQTLLKGVFLAFKKPSIHLPQLLNIRGAKPSTLQPYQIQALQMGFAAWNHEGIGGDVVRHPSRATHHGVGPNTYKLMDGYQAA